MTQRNFSEMSLEYNIENKIQLLEWSKFCTYLSLIESVYAILSIRGGNAKKDSL